MIDFTDCKIEHKKYYDGFNGKKLSIYYNDELYMLKFSKIRKIDSCISGDSYENNTINEHISSKVFEILGFNVHKTLLGYYQDKIVVACKDFEGFDNYLIHFGKIKNAILDKRVGSIKNTDFFEALITIDMQKAIDSTQLRNFYLEMFVADSLIANYDRHNGNFGLLCDRNNNISIAPIFDCGSSLYSQLSTDKIECFLKHKGNFNDLMQNQTTSAITIEGKKINPYIFLKNNDNKDICNALLKVCAKIDIPKINALIDSITIINDTRKIFYKLALKQRAAFLESLLDGAIKFRETK